MNNLVTEQPKVLITYATRTGYTAGVTEAIGKTLAEHNIFAHVVPMEKVKDLSIYKVIIMGSAIQNRQWLPEAKKFIEKNIPVIKQKPVAIFSVCMTMAMSNAEKYKSGVLSWVEPIRSMTDPFSEGLFAGALDIKKIPNRSDRFKFRVSVLFGVWKEGDYRDWNKIISWSEELVPTILS